jgi:hypothetical protein
MPKPDWVNCTSCGEPLYADPLVVCVDTGARSVKGRCSEHKGDACLVNLPSLYQSEKGQRIQLIHARKDLQEIIHDVPGLEEFDGTLEESIGVIKEIVERME